MAKQGAEMEEKLKAEEEARQKGDEEIKLAALKAIEEKEAIANGTRESASALEQKILDVETSMSQLMSRDQCQELVQAAKTEMMETLTQKASETAESCMSEISKVGERTNQSIEELKASVDNDKAGQSELKAEIEKELRELEAKLEEVLSSKMKSFEESSQGQVITIVEERVRTSLEATSQVKTSLEALQGAVDKLQEWSKTIEDVKQQPNSSQDASQIQSLQDLYASQEKKINQNYDDLNFRIDRLEIDALRTRVTDLSKKLAEKEATLNSHTQSIIELLGKLDKLMQVTPKPCSNVLEMYMCRYGQEIEQRRQTTAPLGRIHISDRVSVTRPQSLLTQPWEGRMGEVVCVRMVKMVDKQRGREEGGSVAVEEGESAHVLSIQAERMVKLRVSVGLEQDSPREKHEVSDVEEPLEETSLSVHVAELPHGIRGFQALLEGVESLPLVHGDGSFEGKLQSPASLRAHVLPHGYVEPLPVAALLQHVLQHDVHDGTGETEAQDAVSVGDQDAEVQGVGNRLGDAVRHFDQPDGQPCVMEVVDAKEAAAIPPQILPHAHDDLRAHPKGGPGELGHGLQRLAKPAEEVPAMVVVPDSKDDGEVDSLLLVAHACCGVLECARLSRSSRSSQRELVLTSYLVHIGSSQEPVEQRIPEDVGAWMHGRDMNRDVGLITRMSAAQLLHSANYLYIVRSTNSVKQHECSPSSSTIRAVTLIHPPPRRICSTDPTSLHCNWDNPPPLPFQPSAILKLSPSCSSDPPTPAITITITTATATCILVWINSKIRACRVGGMH
ncbi:hypothetical protein GUITHDRAFT_165875 [Guillardia theta CCMP2712]|uniref:Uncharacterized protein n=1 Tax=Guillardia theta (strain CCMP2712) TaxID=905079 RepID=L1IIX4_GUITC|nr:hypothetical protein GUITHDRAFT_165875 [Guillardia theta CCMP2712]EKX35859.1 hypothetical protein GUITHDRAFT_165875 [Guillardia theta CCMP2712]|eukprot:XP_005822839.1 hypothetical protein GUITHDRAFT_165875 [Guillardia theta CCMP2712]